jgi:phytol kinase
MIQNNWVALLITFFVALAWLRLNDFAAQRGRVESRLSRKIIHMGTGPMFVLCWLLFDAAPLSRWLAALVPFSITVQFALVGLGIMKDEAAVKAMSRSGDRREILRGPLFYGIIFVALTLLYWTESPIGMIALMLMCGGDGLADIVGRRYGKVKLPWNGGKSWAGSAGMFVGGWSFALAVYGVYAALGMFTIPWETATMAITGTAIVGTLVESIPLRDVDNLTVTLAAVISGHLLFL